jgi:phosphohistidine swiveling domain-containing protein
MKEQLYKKTMTRSMSLVRCQSWYEGERFGLPKICHHRLFYDPLFIYKPGKGVSVYYNWTDPAQDPEEMTAYFNDHLDEFEGLATQHAQDCAEMKGMATTDADAATLYNQVQKLWPLISASVSICSASSNASPELTDKALSVRSNSESSHYIGDSEVMKRMIQASPNDFKDLLNFITFEEFKAKELLRSEEVTERVKGYVYYQGRIHIDHEITHLFTEKNITLVDTPAAADIPELKGSVAYRGNVEGIVKVVFVPDEQMDKVEKGNILVAPMTTPDYLPLMKKAAAFVTDEGGITCHAAIVARELKKPCIIGTKFATQVLKDGDRVAVDADNGQVRIIGKH